MLELPFAFHSSQVDPILKSFGELADNVLFHKPEIPVASTMIADNVGLQIMWKLQGSLGRSILFDKLGIL